MKFKNIFFVVALSVFFCKVTTADWYDTHLALKLAVDCNNFINSGAEADATRDDGVREWILTLGDECKQGRGIIEYSKPVSFTVAEEVLNASPTGAFFFYNDLISFTPDK